MAEEQKQTSEGEKKKEDWMNSKWRPAMGWMYMLTCITDFVLFPILWSLLQTIMKQPITQWQPLTLQGAGLFHIAMGAVLGIAAYGRTQEKLGGANNGGAPAPITPSTGFGTPAPGTSFTPAPGWGTTSTTSSSFGSSAGTGAPAAEVITGFGGKPAPVIPPFPEK